METQPLDLRTRLRNAIEGDDTEDAIDCLRRGLDPDVCFEWYGVNGTIPAVSLCVRSRRVAIVEALVEAGCSVNQPDSRGMTPLHYVAKRGDEKMAALLLSKQAEVNRRTHRRITPLIMAAQKRHLEVVKMLVEAGADVNAYDTLLLTPLHIACTYYRSWPVVTYLLSKGATVNARCIDGNTPLLAAAIHGKLSLEILRGLLESGTDVNRRNKRGQNVLHIFLTGRYCSTNDDKADLIEHMLSTPNRCDVNATTSRGHTPLHLAVLYNSLRSARVLIRAGCVLECKGTRKRTPMGYALKHRNYNFIELLTAAGVVIPRPEWNKLRKSLKDDSERLKRLLEVGADFPKLSNMCRRAFYEYFGAEARTRVENLPLCPMIKRYLAFEIL